MWKWLHDNSPQLQAVAAVATAATFFLILNSIGQTRSTISQAYKQAQSVTVQAIADASRGLVLKAIDDPQLRPLIDPEAQVTDAMKVQAFVGVLIQHFAAAHRQWKLGQVSSEYWEEIRRDACVFFGNPTVRGRWNDVKRLYQDDFIQFVDTCA